MWARGVCGLLCVGLAVAGLGGCSPFETPESLVAAQQIPPLTTAPGAVNLEVVFVERPAGDRLLGAELWNSLDQTAAFDDQTRQSLEKSGFRVGVAGSVPSEALQTLLGLTPDFADVPAAEQEKKLVGRQAIVVDGGMTEVQVGPVWDAARVPIDRVGAEAQTWRTLESVRCVYKVTARRLQDGWVRLNFLPQVHYGASGPVINPGDNRFELTYSQRVEEYPQRQFSVTLTVGDMAILSCDPQPEDSLGRLFFVGPEEHSTVQRLLVVRLANMSLADDPYQETR